jgi:hypothetical protein
VLVATVTVSKKHRLTIGLPGAGDVVSLDDDHIPSVTDQPRSDLPTVIWICPTSTQSEHPAFLPAAGAAYVAPKIDAIAATLRSWAKTVFILNYDENDGLFDQVRDDRLLPVADLRVGTAAGRCRP